MNLATFRLRIGQTLNLKTNAEGTERDLVDSYINEAVEQFLLKTKVNKKTAQVSLTDDVGDYTLDPIMLSFDDMWIGSPSDSGYVPMLEPIDSWDVRAMRNVSSVTPGPSRYYAFEGNVIMLYPTPSTGDVLHIVYVPRPSPMTDDSHDPSAAPYGEVPSEFHHIVEAYAKWKSADYADDGSSQVGAMYQAEYERGLIEAKVLLSRKAGMFTGMAKVGRRNRLQRYASPGVDTGG